MVTTREDRIVYGCAAVLLSYPGEQIAEDLEAVRFAAEGLGRRGAGPALASLAQTLDRMGKREAERVYVSTFDLGRRITLNLTFYSHGDTRSRGAALAALAEEYAMAGMELSGGELPDFLPALLELAASTKVEAEILARQEASLRTLADALAHDDSIYQEVVEVLIATLPRSGRRNRPELRLSEDGPPLEMVGLGNLPGYGVAHGGGGSS
ncbi:MAG: nitrate reductase molybdenum cofactor assembly chaperone [Actinomycetota bacterium]|nr:nitrate reductase molybdenum cofactor assembly chaperone [Actinomycetota bacterium]